MLEQQIEKQKQKIADIERKIAEKQAEQMRNFGSLLGNKTLTDRKEKAELRLAQLESKKAEKEMKREEGLRRKDGRTLDAIRKNKTYYNTSTKGKFSWDNRYKGSRATREAWKQYYKKD